MRVLHIVTSLGLGGTESVLLRLLERTASDCEVVVLKPNGIVGEMIERLRIPVRSLNLGGRVPNPSALWKLSRWSRAFRPDVVQTWLYAADLAGGVARMATGAPVVWNIRSTMIEADGLSLGTRAVIRLGALASRAIPATIVYGSNAAAAAHTRHGYPAGASVVIPNGIDVDRFRPDEEHRRSIRAELGIADDAVVVGLAGRFDPLKDHRTFIDAAGRIAQALPGVVFVLAGEGITAGNSTLMTWIGDAGIERHTRLLGRRMDVERVTAAFDIAVLSSHSEGFPNVVAEAMACGVPCVVTDVGDAAEIVADTGVVVPPRDSAALAAGIIRLSVEPAEERRRRGAGARARIEREYSLERMVRRYDALHAEVARSRRR